MELFGLIKEDWKSIPQNYRYFFIAGASLLLIDWVTDHWGKTYFLYGHDFHKLFFNAGVTLILLFFILILSKQFLIAAFTAHYRKIYPLDKVNQTYSLVVFNGYMILFDKRNQKKKTAYHVATSKTAQDLGFWGSEHVEKMSYASAVKSSLRIKTPVGVKVNEYRYSGQIRTR